MLASKELGITPYYTMLTSKELGITLAILDKTTTLYAVGTGIAVEANPFVNHLFTIAGVSLGIIILYLANVWVVYYAARDKLAITLITAIMGAAVLSNTLQLL